MSRTEQKQKAEELFKKAKFYKKNKTLIHVTLDNNFFYNGLVLEVLSDSIILKEIKLGEVMLFFNRIKKLEPKKNDTA